MTEKEYDNMSKEDWDKMTHKEARKIIKQGLIDVVTKRYGNVDKIAMRKAFNRKQVWMNLAYGSRTDWKEVLGESGLTGGIDYYYDEVLHSTGYFTTNRQHEMVLRAEGIHGKGKRV